jgi:hypothetical protein
VFYLIRSPEVEVAKLFSIWHSGEHGEVDIWVFMDLTNHTVEERSADSGSGFELLQQNPRYPDFKHKTTNEAFLPHSSFHESTEQPKTRHSSMQSAHCSLGTGTTKVDVPRNAY